MRRAASCCPVRILAAPSAAQVLDAQTNVRYNEDTAPVKAARKPVQYIPYEKIGQETVRVIRRSLSQLYQGVEDGVADGVAIESGNTIYVVDSGRDGGNLTFGVRKKISVSDETRRRFYIDQINRESAENGYGSREIFERLGVKLDNDSGSDVGRESRQDVAARENKPQNNEGRVFDRNGDRGVKFSRKDSEGRTLTEAQTEYFKESRGRDDEGNLLVVYRGMMSGDFTVFDSSDSNVESDMGRDSIFPLPTIGQGARCGVMLSCGTET